MTYEVLPFSGSDFLRATQDAIKELFDRGWLARNVWMRMVGGSPLYNADFSYWTAATTLDGWTANSSTFARERASDNIALSETSLALTSAVGYAALSSQWKRYLHDFRGQTLTFHCWVKTSAGSNARLNLYTGSNNYSTYHSGNGNWELLHVEADTATSDTDIEPRLYIDTTSTAYYNLPFISGGGFTVREYPFPLPTMPTGPSQITIANMDVRLDELASGRGMNNVRQMPRHVQLLGGQVRRHHDEDATTSIGILDFSGARVPPRDGHLMWLRGDGPLTIPSSALGTDNLEIDVTEELLLAKVAAGNLLKQHRTGAAPSVQQLYGERIEELSIAAYELSQGAGHRRDVATYSLGW